MIGRTLGHYRILEEIGKGGMGVVYRAHDEHLNREVAIKVLPPGALLDDTARKRFRKEALALSKLNHPNIETVFDFDTQDGVDFLVMEHIPGVTLSDKLAAGRLPEKEVGRLGVQLAEGLTAAHEQGVIHRDLKPGNLRITPDSRLKILDFGLAKFIRPASATATTESLSETEGRAGTPLYMAPEQQRGEKSDARTDICAAGLVLMQMATGELPVVRGRALGRKVSAGLERIIGKCLEDDPELRYQSAKDLAVDLQRLGAPTPARTLSRRVVLVATAALAALAVLVGLNVGGLRARLFGAATPKIDSLAVLPLKNLMNDPAQDYFVEGMHEALTAELSKISALRVISRTSAMHYKGTDKTMPQIARELGVAGLIEGSVLREGDQVRVTVQLIHGPTDRHLWAESYQRELRAILALQSELARAIAGQVRVTLTPQEQTLLASARSVNPEAYESYLKGRYHFNRWPEPEFSRCTKHFQEAIEREPNYPDAHAGLALCYAVMPWHYPPKEVLPLARAAAQEALRLDPNQAEAYAALGAVNVFFDWDWAAADQNLRRALELSPNSAYTHATYSDYLVFLGRAEDAIREAKKAVELDPVSILMNRNLSFVYQLSRRYEDYAAQSRITLELAPENDYSKFDLAWAYALQGMREEARNELKKGTFPWGEAMVRATLGERQRALLLAAQLKRRGWDGFALAMICATLGESDESLQLLQQAHQEHDAMMVQVKTNPALDPLRSDPRFQDLLRRMNFPE